MILILKYHQDGYFTELWMFSGLRMNIYFTAKLEELDQNIQL